MNRLAAVALLALAGIALASAASAPPLENSVRVDTKPELATKNEEPKDEAPQEVMPPTLLEEQETNEDEHVISKRETIQNSNGDNEISDPSEEEARGRRRKGLKRIVLPVFLMLGAMTVPVLFGLVALAAFKGLWSGMTALAVTAALALRRLLSSNHSVWVPPPPPPPPAPHHITEYYTDYRRADDYNNRKSPTSHTPYF